MQKYKKLHIALSAGIFIFGNADRTVTVVIEFVGQIQGDVEAGVLTHAIRLIANGLVQTRPGGDLHHTHLGNEIEQVADVEADHQGVVEEALLQAEVQTVVGGAAALADAVGTPPHTAGCQCGGTVAEIQLQVEVLAQGEGLADAGIPGPIAGEVLIQQVVAVDQVTIETARDVHAIDLLDTVAEEDFHAKVLALVEVLIGGHRVGHVRLGIAQDLRIAGYEVGTAAVEGGEGERTLLLAVHIAQLEGVGELGFQGWIACHAVLAVRVIHEGVQLVNTRALHTAREAELQRVIVGDVVFDVHGREEEVTGKMAVVEVGIDRVHRPQIRDGV